jgi:hypothetical protein
MCTPSTIISSAKKVFSAKVPSSTVQEAIQPSTKTPHSIMESASFPLLPTEIRLQIWRNAIPEGRFIWVETSSSVDVNYSTGEFTIGTLSPTYIPTVLHINHESRCLGLSIFHLSLKLNKDDKCTNSIGYWNPSADTIFLSNTDSVTQLYRPENEKYTLGEIMDLCHAKHLALPWNVDISAELQFKMPGLTERPWMPRWLTSEALESVTFVVPFNLTAWNLLLLQDYTAWNEKRKRKISSDEPEKSRWKIMMKSQSKAMAYSISTHDWIQGSRLTIAETKAEIERIFQEFRERDEQDGRTWKVPVVDVQAIAHDTEEIRRRRKDFWIYPGKRENELSRHNSFHPHDS